MSRKQIFIILSLLILFQNAFGQGLDFWNRCGDKFDRQSYPADSFSVQQDTFHLGRTSILITVLQEKGDREAQVWVEQRRHNRTLKSKYLGGIGSGETGLALQSEQLLPGFFLINYQQEFTGMYYLISAAGTWYEIPGGGIFANPEKSILYTSVPVECGGCEIGRFSLNSRTLVTKNWDGNGVAWDEVKDRKEYVDLSKNGNWIQWETR